MKATKLLARPEALSLLREGVGRLAALTATVPPVRLHEPAAPGEWSPAEVLAHLRACADAWGDAIARIAAEDHPTFAAPNPRTLIKGTDYFESRYADALAAYAAQRARLLAFLEALAPEAWDRGATVKVRSQPGERTLGSYASQLAHHEGVHLEQLERLLAPRCRHSLSPRTGRGPG